MWAVLAGFGAGFLVSAVLFVVFTTTARFLGASIEWVGGVTTVGAIATALSVVYTVGGRIAVTAYAAIVIVERLLALPSLMRLVSRSFPKPRCARRSPTSSASGRRR